MKPTLTSARRSLHSFALCGLLLAAVSSLPAATLTVTNLNDSGPGTLRQAIADASAGDNVNFGVTGTITLTSGVLALDKNLTIQGPGTASMILSGNNLSGVFYIPWSAALAVIISDLTVANGNSTYGGGLYDQQNNSTAALTLSNIVFTNNMAVSGGAIFHTFNAGTLTILNSIVSGNSARTAGGGILSSGLLIVSNCTVSANAVTNGDGGGIYIDGIGTDNIAVSNSSITSNTASISGGGIYKTSGGVLSVRSCVFSGNSAGLGGAIRNGGLEGYDTEIRECSFIQNYASTNGGAIYNRSSETISSSLFFANVAANNGGAIYNINPGAIFNQGGMLTLHNCTVSSNNAASGGGIYHTVNSGMHIKSATIFGNSARNGGGVVKEGAGDSKFSLTNCIVAGNIASTSGPDCYGEITRTDYDLIQDTNGCTFSILGTNNIYGQDSLLGPLQDNGGPTWTHALLSNSPAIDAGSSGGLITDQRGGVRPYVKPGNTNVFAGDGSDIGAFESGGYLRLTSVNKTNNDIRVQFTTDLGHDYHVERRDALDTNAWTSLPGLIPGTGGIVPFVETNAALLPKGFYRVRAD